LYASLPRSAMRFKTALPRLMATYESGTHLGELGASVPLFDPHASINGRGRALRARRRKHIDLAERWLAMIPQTTGFPGLRPRVEAALLEAQGDVEGA
jgi:hypothetical protein